MSSIKMRLFSIILIFILFIACKPDKEKVIGIQIYKGFNKNLVDTIQKTIIDFYGNNVVLLPSKDIPKSAFVKIKTHRYRADSLIRIIRREKPDSVDIVIGLTSKDISTTKYDAFGNIKKPKTKYTDWGIFGLGFRPGSSCIVSSYRLKHINKSKYIDRLKKVCIHELGHNFGLKHCTSGENCVMKDAVESIKTVDNESLILCSVCKLKIS